MELKDLVEAAENYIEGAEPTKENQQGYINCILDIYEFVVNRHYTPANIEVSFDEWFERLMVAGLSSQIAFAAWTGME